MISTIILQAPGGGVQQILMIGLIIIVFYFFMIRPQMKKAKDEKLFKEGIKKGDKVVTIGGVHGRVLEVNDSTFMLEIDTNVKVKIEKSGISAEATKQFMTPPKKQ